MVCGEITYRQSEASSVREVFVFFWFPSTHSQRAGVFKQYTCAVHSAPPAQKGAVQISLVQKKTMIFDSLKMDGRADTGTKKEIPLELPLPAEVDYSYSVEFS